MNSVFFSSALLLLAALGLSLPSRADAETREVMTYIHCQPEAAGDERQLFAWEILRQALERTGAAYGPFRIGEAPISLLQSRQIQALEHGRNINVALLPVEPDSASHAVIPVRIPVIGGLWGYRVLLVRADRQTRFASIRTLADLGQVTIGQSWFWADATILRAAGLQVARGDSYEGLFRMLSAGRFDAFSRSVVEAPSEYEAHRSLEPEIGIEPHLLLHYPMPEYLWFPDDPEGHRLARRVRDGLQSMVADHSLCQTVERRFGNDLRSLDLARRVVIDIPNPLLGAEDHLAEPAYWCNPLPGGDLQDSLRGSAERK